MVLKIMKKKIFVMVGSTYPFDRLIKEVDKLDSKKYEVFAQIGESKLIPKNIKFEKFLNYEEIQEKINSSNIIITHAGIGTIIDALTKNKQIILFPRLKKYGEVIDDHQIEVCKAFSEKYGINYTTNEKQLLKLIKTAKTIKIKKENKLVNEIERVIEME